MLFLLYYFIDMNITDYLITKIALPDLHTGNNICITGYFLSDVSDLEHRPDLVWPQSKDISCSVISPCSALLAVATIDNTVVIWDRYLGNILQFRKTSSLWIYIDVYLT